MNLNAKATVKFDCEQEFLKKAQNTILAGAQKKAATMQCKEHEQSATVALEDGGSFRVSGCCKPFIAEVQQTIFKK